MRKRKKLKKIKKTVESFTFEDENDYEYEIFSTN